MSEQFNQKEIAKSLSNLTVEQIPDMPLPGEESVPTIDDSVETQQVPVEEAPVVEENEVTEQLVPEQPAATVTEEQETIAPRKQQNVTVTDTVTFKGEWDPEGDTVILPSSFDKETRETLERLPKIDLLDNPKSRDWAKTISDGLSTSTYNETFIPTLEDDTAEFGQAVEHNGARLGGAQPKFKSAENQTLTGERAVIRLMTHLGLGTLFQVPLWHTGFWVTFKAPTESEIIELNRKLMSDKIELGRHSYGLAFSNTTSYTTDRLVEFALNHVYDTTVMSTEIPASELKNIIDCQDIPSLLWGFVCTMYPKGFQFRRACIADPEKCNHVIEEMLNVTKLQWVNRAALTEWQRSHMASRRSNSKDKASVLRYKEEMMKTQNRRIVFNEGESSEIAITLKTPTIAQYVDSGHRWISEMVELVDRTLGLDAKDSERNNYITRHGQASSMRQYVHWVESIEMETNSINDSESIENSFNTLSSHNHIRNSFIESVVKYINESTIAVIGIPVYDCPACGTGQDKDSGIELPNHKNIIPLDVMQLFFDLLTQRLLKISDR